MKRLVLFFSLISPVAAACGTAPAPTATEVDTATAATAGSDSAADDSAGTVEEPDNEAAKETTSGSWPDLIASQVDGSAFDAGDYANQDVMLWFWAPW